ncbi:MAG: two-component system, LytTR family, sensor kinase [Bacteroidota bacterium]|nr:two-component system, LytTR family, sensor kinase [Bacteroidota bacterium]
MKDKKNRLLYMFGIGLMISSLFKPLFFRADSFFDAIFIVITVATVVILEGNLRIDNGLDKKYSWATMPKKRTISQFLISLFYTVFLLYILMFVIHILKSGKYELINPKMRQVLIPAIFVTIAAIAIDISYQFFKAWKQSLIEVEKYKTESANAQLQNLKNQLNPHFLFNNLSVLTSLVYKDQDKAVDFINELSKVYRYVLDNKSAELVSLQEELAFLEHYIYLLKIRFGDSISFDIKISFHTEGGYLPPMCLQMLVENTIQHNETSQANPLKVLIYTENNHLIVENAIQPRSDKTESSQTGLKNIESRYAFFTEKKIEIMNNGKVFKVVLPLILKK